MFRPLLNDHPAVRFDHSLDNPQFFGIEPRIVISKEGFPIFHDPKFCRIWRRLAFGNMHMHWFFRMTFV